MRQSDGYRRLRGALWCALAAATTIAAACKGPTDPNEPPTVTISHPPPFATVSGLLTIRALASDYDGVVTRVVFFIDGLPVATDAAAPWEYEWNADAASAGAHTLVTRAYDDDGAAGDSPLISISVVHPFSLTIENTVFTSISITVTGHAERTIAPSASTTFDFPSNPSSVFYSASTSGRTAQGTRIGLLVTWSNSLSVAADRSRTVSLVISPDLFFIRFRNSGVSYLTPFYVNYGLVSQTRDDIVIPPDGATYAVGYYRAFTNTEVRAYLEQSPLSYVYWRQGTHFTLPFTTNQAVTLVNSSFGAAAQVEVGASPRVLSGVAHVGMAVP